MAFSSSDDIIYIEEPGLVDDAVILESEAVVDAEVLPPQGEPCTTCGAPVESGDKFCAHCGADVPQNAVMQRQDMPGPPDLSIEGSQKHIACKTCGAHITVDPDERSYACPFCDSTYVVEHSQESTGRQPPEFVIGFAISPEQALAKFGKWIANNSLFRPGDLAHAEIQDKLRGVYLPFWRFAMRSQSRWDAQIGEYWYKTESYYTTNSQGKRVRKTRRVQKTEWWPLAGQHHLFHRDYLVSGSKGLPQREADRIKPFNLPALKRYQSCYIAGWITEEYSVEKQVAQEICRKEFLQRERIAVAAHLPGDTYSNLRVSTRFSDATSDLCLLPVYLLSYRYQDKVYRFLVNGQTGRIAGDKPWSSKRIWAGLGIGAVVLAVAVLIILFIMGVFSTHA